jgi:hypothetical protein
MENHEQSSDKKASSDKLKIVVRVRQLLGKERGEREILEASGEVTSTQ